MKDILRTKSADLPQGPGVYHFLDEKGDVLYVGKAKSLKNRVKQYLLKDLNRGPAIDQMIEQAMDIKWIETESEIEAVLVEAELINKLKPKYNVRLKDDKSFLVIKITKEDFPCVGLVRFRNVDLSDKKAEYFGPYPAGLLLKKSIRYLRRIFPFRDCSKSKFIIHSKKCRPCLYGDIGVCSIPCQGFSKSEYRRNILYFKNFLKGKKKEVITSLERTMKKLSRGQKFEEASIVRNQLLALNHIKNVRIGLRDDLYNFSDTIFSRIECYDISNIMGDHAVGSMVVTIRGKIEKDEYRKFRIKNNPVSFQRKLESRASIIGSQIKSGMTNSAASDLSRLREVLERRFRNDWPLPNLIVIDGGNQQLKVAMEALKQFNLNVPVVAIAKGPQRKKADFYFSDQNIAKYIKESKDLQNILIVARDEAHRFAISYYRKIHEKELFE